MTFRVFSLLFPFLCAPLRPLRLNYRRPAMAVDKSPGRIRAMFGEIAPRYDLLNHLLSAGIDRWWRRRTVRLAPAAGEGPVLDVCTGTGDLALAYWRSRRGQLPVVGVDFCRPMLQLGREKVRRAGAAGKVTLLEADALSLPFADDLFQVVCIAFGLRNLADPDRGLRGDGPGVPAGGAGRGAGVFAAAVAAAAGDLRLVFPPRPAADRTGIGPQSAGSLQLPSGQRRGVFSAGGVGPEDGAGGAGRSPLLSADVWHRELVRGRESVEGSGFRYWPGWHGQ